MRRWYEPRPDRPDLTKEDVKKRGFMGFMETLWREFFELIKLNLLFLITCIPVVTIPLALTAMSDITVTMVCDKNHFLWPDYWKAFKRSVAQSLLGGLAYAVILVAFTASTVFYYRLMSATKLFVVLSGFSACLLLFAFASAMYFFPMAARVDLPTKTLLKNAVILTFTNFRKTLPAMLWGVLFLILGIGLLPVSAIFVVFIMFSFMSLISTYLLWPSIAREVLGERPEPPKAEERKPEAAAEVPELRSAGIDELVFDDEEDGKKDGTPEQDDRG